ncbi:hypothetical protein [Halocatena salina]|uniref:Uncharacterized protein n=1 Tax=Halocatena salina TaxID=2934340 RepID=A0A8U0A6X7_9EURY|nr:hypothetical protein [Halocatena salina]UPM44609.1 hypothetical protein MW046_16290 [Halocatena salina]
MQRARCDSAAPYLDVVEDRFELYLAHGVTAVDEVPSVIQRISEEIGVASAPNRSAPRVVIVRARLNMTITLPMMTVGVRSPPRYHSRIMDQSTSAIDTGMDMFDATGEEIGMVATIEDDVAYVDFDPGLTDEMLDTVDDGVHL